MLDKVRDEGTLQMPVLLVAGKNDVLDWGPDDETAQLRGQRAIFDIVAAKNTKVQMIIITNGGPLHVSRASRRVQRVPRRRSSIPGRSIPARLRRGIFPKPPTTSTVPPKTRDAAAEQPGVIPGRQQIGQQGA